MFPEFEHILFEVQLFVIAEPRIVKLFAVFPIKAVDVLPVAKLTVPALVPKLSVDEFVAK